MAVRSEFCHGCTVIANIGFIEKLGLESGCRLRVLPQFVDFRCTSLFSLSPGVNKFPVYVLTFDNLDRLIPRLRVGVVPVGC